MNRIPWLLCAFLVMSGISHAEPAVPPKTEDRIIRVITYNVQFLPGIAERMNKRPEPEYRIERIAKEVSRFDIVALQELFEDKWRKPFLDHLRAEWKDALKSYASPQPEGRFSGGCLIATPLPVLKTGSTIFEHYSKPEDFGVRADGFAAKGVIHARVAIDANRPEHFVDVFVTHLEARDDSLRPLQYKEMAEFILSAGDPTRPALMMGDFNTRGMKEYRDDPNSQYTQLMKELQRARPGHDIIDVWPHLKGDALGGTSDQESEETGRRIDYIFVANPPSPAPKLVPLSVKVNLFQDPKVTALSDHNAVEAEIEWVDGVSK